MEDNLINLNESEDKDPELEDMREKIAKKQNDLRKMQSMLREKERKKRAHQLIEMGALVLKAGIARHDKNLLLGAFTYIAEEIKKDPYQAQRWTEEGSRIFMSDTELKKIASE